MVKVLGKGAFGEVWLAQAFQIEMLDPRNKSSEANKRRQKIKKTKNVERLIDKHVRKGKDLQLVAVKKILG